MLFHDGDERHSRFFINSKQETEFLCFCPSDVSPEAVEDLGGFWSRARKEPFSKSFSESAPVAVWVVCTL